MSKEAEAVMSCDGCGATIYPEHLERHTAERRGDRLLCPHCCAESDGAAQNDPILLEDDADAPPPTGIHSFNTGGISATKSTGPVFRRPLLRDGPHATRCRTFHCKLTDASMSHLDEMINEWADANDEVQIKFVTSCVGVVEGKHSDQHLIVTVFY